MRRLPTTATLRRRAIPLLLAALFLLPAGLAKAERAIIGEAARAMTENDTPALTQLTRSVSPAKLRALTV